MSSPFNLVNRVRERGPLIFVKEAAATADVSGVFQIPPGVWRVGVMLSVSDTDQIVTATFQAAGNKAQDAAAKSGNLTINQTAGTAGASLAVTAAVGTADANGGMLVDIPAASGNYGNRELMLPFGLHYSFLHTTCSTGTFQLICIASEV